MTLPNFAMELQPMLTPETREWEYKSASLLDTKEKLKECLGKQVSAFANSGGGRLVFGIDPTTMQLQPCTSKVGRQQMEDYLSNLVSECVDDQLQTFSVLRMNFSETDDRCIFLVNVEDSPTAPHQSRFDKTYYWRLPGKSEPAPHFHLKNLSTRRVSCIVQPEMIDDAVVKITSDSELTVGVRLTVRNMVGFVAQPFGIRVQLSDIAERAWTISESKSSAHLLSGDYLFPMQSTPYFVSFIGSTLPYRNVNPTAQRFWRLAEAFSFTVEAFSQNYSSPPLIFDQLPRRALDDELNFTNFF